MLSSIRTPRGLDPATRTCRLPTAGVLFGRGERELRRWLAQIDGYAVLYGIWYGATQTRTNNLSCNYRVMTGPRYVLVVTGPDGRRFGIRHDGTPIHGDPQHTRGPVVDDVDAGAEIGDAGPTCTPILLDIAGEQHVLFAGSADYAQQAFTAVNGHQYPIRDGAWMSFPEPFTPGMVVTITGLDGDGKELFSIPPAALEVDKLAPLFGPGWTGFAPAE